MPTKGCAVPAQQGTKYRPRSTHYPPKAARGTHQRGGVRGVMQAPVYPGMTMCRVPVSAASGALQGPARNKGNKREERRDANQTG